MTIGSLSRTQIRFGRFEFDSHKGALSRQGHNIALPDKPLAILALLLENPGEIVSRKTLVERLWADGTHVDFDNNLNASIRKLREALGDSADRSLYLETVPRKGYRFVAPVTSAEQGSPKSGAANKNLRFKWILGLAFLGAIAYGFSLFWSQPGSSKKVMLAFLPMEVIGDAGELLPICEGLTEELITQCGGWAPDQLGVIAATSVRQYRGTEKTVAQIGAELSIDYLVEGAVQREGNILRITTQLIHVSDQSHVWSSIYTREMGQMFQLRREIGLDVTRQLAGRLTHPPAEVHETELGPEIYDDFLKARYHLGQNHVAGFEKARDFLLQVVAKAPQFAQGHARLAEAHNMIGAYSSEGQAPHYDRAKQAAEEALALEPENGLALANMGFSLMYGAWEFSQAGPYFKKALDQAPGDATVHALGAAWFSAVARHMDAVEAAENARLLNPMSLNANRDLGWYYYYAGQFEKALAQSQHVADLDPNDLSLCALFTEWVVGENRGAFDRFQNILPADEAVQAEFRKVRDQGVAATNDWIVKILSSAQQSQLGYILANRLAAVGEHQQAIQVIRDAYTQKAAWVPYAPVDPGFQPLFALPDFKKLVSDMALPIRHGGMRYIPRPMTYYPSSTQ